MAEKIPTFNGCSAGKYCSEQQMTEVGEDKTKIYHRTVTTLTGTGPAYTGSKTETYIVKPAGPLGSFPTWTLAATSTDGGKTQTFTDAAGADLKKSLSPGGNLTKNTQIQTQQTLAKGLGTNASGQTGAVLDKINPEQQKKLKIIDPNVASSTAAGTSPAPVPVDLQKEIASSNATRKSYPNLRYPIDLANTKQDVIKFTMLEYQPKKFSEDSARGDLGGFSGRDQKREGIGSVVLPIPSGISDTNACDWQSDSMNAAEAFAANIALTGIIKGIGEAAEKTGDVAEAAAKSPEVKTGFAGLFAGLAMGGSSRQILQRTEGVVLNPNMELLFNGPTLRPFSFTFKMSARSDKEAKQIIGIIRFFKQGMSPQKSESNLFLKSPNTFKIQYLHLGKDDHPYIGKIKECALQSVVVSYAPEGQYATYTDGVMVSYEMQMQFTELEPIFNDDYGEGTGSSGPDKEIGF